MYLLLFMFLANVEEKFQKTNDYFEESIINLENEDYYLKAKFKDDGFKKLTKEEKDHYYVYKAMNLMEQLENTQKLVKERFKDDEEALLFECKLVEFKKKLAILQEKLIKEKSEKYPDLKIYLEEVKKTNRKKKLIND